MVIDTVIIILLIAIALVAGVILWNAASAKTYDPNRVDLSGDFDPKHDHFSREHVEKLRQAEAEKRRPQARAASATSDSLMHLTPQNIQQQSAIESDRRAGQERRSTVDRRSKEDRRNYSDRRMLSDRRLQPA